MGGRTLAYEQSLGGLTGITGAALLSFGIGLAVVALVVLGLVASMRGAGPKTSVVMPWFASAGVLVIGALVGNLSAPLLGGTYREPVVLTAAAGVSLQLDPVSMSFVSQDQGQAECRSQPDGRTMVSLSALDLGRLGPGTVRAGLTLPDGSNPAPAIEIFIDGGSLPDGAAPVSWSGTASVANLGADQRSGQLTFLDLRLATLSGKPAADPSATGAVIGWPLSLSGGLRWTCGPWPAPPGSAEPPPPSTAAGATGPPATPQATPAAAASPASPAPPVAVRGRDWEWRDVWYQDPQGQSPSLTGVLFTGAGFTAWGPNASGGSAMVASTSDLSGWGSVGSVGQFAGVRIIGLAWAPAGIVALGSDKAGAVHAWVSADGRSWKAGPARTGIDGTVRAIASSAGGIYYATGTAKGGCDVAIWFSYDGLTWKPSQTLSGARGACSTGGVSNAPAITLVRDGGAGLVAYGTVPGVGSAFWTSPNKVTWTFHPQPSLGGHVAGLAATRFGYIAVGTTTAGGAMVWLSQDGETWTRTPDQASFAGGALDDVLALDDGSFVAVGSDAGHAFAAWTSTDGLIWVRAPEPLSLSGPLGDADPAMAWGLASDGHASTNPSELLVAVAGGSRAMVSPPTTPGLRTGSLTIELSGLVNLPKETVAGTCADIGDGSGGTEVHILLPDLARPNPAEVSILVGPDGSVTGVSVTTDKLEASLGQGAPIDPLMLATVAASSTASGAATFGNLVNTLAPGVSGRLSGSVAWRCSR